MSETQPQSVSDLDHNLAKSLTKSRRDRWVIIAIIAVALIGIGWVAVRQVQDENRTNHEIVQQISRASAGECQFFQTLGNTPPASNVTLLGVQILVEARTSFVDLGCRGILNPPSPQLIVAAHRLGVTIQH